MKINRPTISIITLKGNSLEDTVECLGSLKKVTYLNYQGVIAGNGQRETTSEFQEKCTEIMFTVSRTTGITDYREEHHWDEICFT